MIDADRILSVTIPAALVTAFGLLVSSMTSCEANTRKLRLEEQRETQQTLREVCGPSADLKSDVGRALICSKLGKN